MSEEKTITIRGINKELYRQALALAKRTGKTVGELVNESLKMLLDLREAAIETIRSVEEGLSGVVGAKEIAGIDEIEVSGRDLEEIDGKVVFRGVKKLKFSNDITKELFDEKIHSIVTVSYTHLTLPTN